MISTWAGETNYGDFKQKVASSVSGLLSSFQATLATISDQTVLSLLENGERYANQAANTKLLKVQTALHLR